MATHPLWDSLKRKLEALEQRSQVLWRMELPRHLRDEAKEAAHAQLSLGLLKLGFWRAWQ